MSTDGCTARVLFASIPNFTEFYSEDVNEGIECICLLIEISVDFDQTLDDEKFRSIEKISFLIVQNLIKIDNDFIKEADTFNTLIDIFRVKFGEVGN